MKFIHNRSGQLPALTSAPHLQPVQMWMKL